MPLLSTLTIAHVRAASEIKFVAMDYDATCRRIPNAGCAVNPSQSDVTTDLQVVRGDEGHAAGTWISGNQAPDLANVSAGWMVEFDAIARWSRSTTNLSGVSRRLRALRT